MQRYPDEIIVLKVVVNENNPYGRPVYQQVYRGRCRLFLHKQAAFRNTKVADCDYKIVVPERTMPDVGENFRIGIKHHNSPHNGFWDLVGYCKDFARYERLCEIYMQMIKENMIYEDMPTGEESPVRVLGVYEDEYLHLEGANFDGQVFDYGSFITAWTKKNIYEEGEIKTGIHLDAGFYNPETGEWISCITAQTANITIVSVSEIHNVGEIGKSRYAFLPRYAIFPNPLPPGEVARVYTSFYFRLYYINPTDGEREYIYESKFRSNIETSPDIKAMGGEWELID